MKAKDTTKKTGKTAVDVKDIKPKANPVGGHHSHKPAANATVIGKGVRKAS